MLEGNTRNSTSEVKRLISEELYEFGSSIWEEKAVGCK